MFVGQRQQLHGSYKTGLVYPSLFPGVFLELELVLETEMALCVTELDFFKKASFALNIGKMGQNWAKIVFF